MALAARHLPADPLRRPSVVAIKEPALWRIVGHRRWSPFDLTPASHELPALIGSAGDALDCAEQLVTDPDQVSVAVHLDGEAVPYVVLSRCRAGHITHRRADQPCDGCRVEREQMRLAGLISTGGPSGAEICEAELARGGF